MKFMITTTIAIIAKIKTKIIECSELVIKATTVTVTEVFLFITTAFFKKFS